MYDVISSAMLRKESIGYDHSKGKVIHKDKISGCDPSKGNVTHEQTPLLWRQVAK